MPTLDHGRKAVSGQSLPSRPQPSHPASARLIPVACPAKRWWRAWRSPSTPTIRHRTARRRSSGARASRWIAGTAGSLSSPRGLSHLALRQACLEAAHGRPRRAAALACADERPAASVGATASAAAEEPRAGGGAATAPTVCRYSSQSNIQT